MDATSIENGEIFGSTYINFVRFIGKYKKIDLVYIPVICYAIY